MSGVENGQPANKTTFDGAYMKANGDTATTGKVDLNNVDAPSGTAITNIQRQFNSIMSAIGGSLNQAKDYLLTWTVRAGFTTTESIKDRAEALSQKVADAKYLQDMVVVITSGVHQGIWILDNATYDTATGKFNRIDTSHVAFAVNLRSIQNIPFEAATRGVMFWRCTAGTNPILDTYGTGGGWENAMLFTEFRDMVIGGFGIEIDGAGIVPYGRLNLNQLAGQTFFGIMRNIFGDYSGTDTPANPSWRAGFIEDYFGIDRWLPQDTDPSLTPIRLLTLNSDGDLTIKRTPAAGDSTKKVATTDFLDQEFVYTQCRLTKVSTNLVLNRHNGRWITTNGKRRLIPSGGVSLAASGLSNNTLYYIYAYDNSGTLTLEASTTGYAIDSSTGLPLKTGDATRTLVGMAKTDGSAAWQYDDSHLHVLSYFNRRELCGLVPFTSDATTSSVTYVELSSSYRLSFLTWADEAMIASASGLGYSMSAFARVCTALGFDGTTAEDTYFENQTTTDFFRSGAALTVRKKPNVLSEGSHYVTTLGKVDNVVYTGYWVGNGTAGTRFALSASVKG